MALLDETAEPGKALSFNRIFLVVLGCFALFFAVSWPLFRSFDLWIFKDRGSSLNLDYLVERHYLLGVNAFYSYGLLPVLIQHITFTVFGRTYRPMMGTTLVVILLTALFWALLARILPIRRAALIAVVLWIPIILDVNPILPYSLVVLSILFTFYFMLQDRLDRAFAASMIGCLSVPSLPLVAAAFVACCIMLKWYYGSSRRPVELVKQFAPGAILYCGLVCALVLVFSRGSTLISLLPILGSKFYRASGLGGFDAFASFLHPSGYSLKYYLAYYLFSSVTWFVLCTLLLVAVAIRAGLIAFQRRSADGRDLVVILCAVLQLVFIFFAYGNRGQHFIYEPVLAAGTLVAISLLPSGQARSIVLATLISLGFMSRIGQDYKVVGLWRTTKPSPATLSLYSEPAFAGAWSRVVELSKTRSVLLLSYGTGVHNYYPSVHNPDAWFLYTGQLFPSDKQRILDAMGEADIIMVDLTSPHEVIDNDAEIQTRLSEMCVINLNPYFLTWQRRSLNQTNCSQ